MKTPAYQLVRLSLSRRAIPPEGIRIVLIFTMIIIIITFA